MDAPNPSPGHAKPEAAAPAAAGHAPAGGIKAWLPLIIAVVAMPALSFVTTKFVLLPKVEVAARNAAGTGAAAEAGDTAGDSETSNEHAEKPAAKHGAAKPAAAPAHGAKKPPAASGHGAKPAAAGHGAKPAAGSQSGKVSYPFGKVLVNVKDSHGARYLLSSFTLVSSSADFSDTVEQNKDQLTDMAMTILGSKTITDLERPGSRNLIRSELITVFNSVLGKGTLQEIFFTEFAIQ